MNETETTIRIFLVDDHQSFSEGLAMLINTNKPEMEVIGTAGNREDAFQAIAEKQPDVILLDVDLGDDNGLEILPEMLAKTNAKIIILTGIRDPLIHQKAVINGASGVLQKTDSAQTILKAIKKVHEGEIWINNEILNQVLNQLTGKSSLTADSQQQKIATLTSREREIIAALVNYDSSTNKAIARQLYISDSTLKNHLTAIYDKLDLKNRVELLKYALANNLDRYEK
jgi:DNA-binding NarL/FixJ family response regulator